MGWILFLILNHSIESTINAKLSISGFAKQVALIDSMDAYKIKVGSAITIEINEKYYSAIVQNITFDIDKKLFALELQNLDFDLIPDSIVKATIIYDQHKVFDELFGSV